MIYVCIALCAVIVVQSIFHRAERKDLYNRIQSKDYKEYRTTTSDPPKQMKSRNEAVYSKWRHEGVDKK